MYHSITIGDKNTWDDWKMIPVSRPVVAPPVEKILSVNVPGRDGTTYLSKSLTVTRCQGPGRELGILSGHGRVAGAEPFDPCGNRSAGVSFQSAGKEQLDPGTDQSAAGG